MRAGASLKRPVQKYGQIEIGVELGIVGSGERRAGQPRHDPIVLRAEALGLLQGGLARLSRRSPWEAVGEVEPLTVGGGAAGVGKSASAIEMRLRGKPDFLLAQREQQRGAKHTAIDLRAKRGIARRQTLIDRERVDEAGVAAACGERIRVAQPGSRFAAHARAGAACRDHERRKDEEDPQTMEWHWPSGVTGSTPSALDRSRLAPGLRGSEARRTLRGP